jgi:hypothetical protein
VARQERFGGVCERVCAQQGWELLPSGVVVKWQDGRHQVVFLEFFDFRGEELVRLCSTIGSAADLSTERLATALRVNATLVHGALAVRDEDLVVVDTMILRDADPGELEATIGYLAETADYYERMIFGTDRH